MARRHRSSGGWSPWGFPVRQPREVEGGIRARGNFGETWWARRWIEALNALGFSSRLARGRSYARRGQVVGYEINPGQVTARVQGSRSRPYSVTIRVKKLSKSDWDAVIAAMADQALFTARLLAGEMPEHIEEAFKTAQVSLFPQSASDLRTECTCPDWANPCKHVAAVYYLLGEAFDVNPFMMFTLRGMSRDAVLDHLREQRGTGAEADEAKVEIAPRPEEEPVDLEIERFWSGPPAIGVRIEKPLVEAAVLKRLGEPGFWTGQRELTAELQKTYRKASATALKMAFAPSQQKRRRK